MHAFPNSLAITSSQISSLRRPRNRHTRRSSRIAESVWLQTTILLDVELTPPMFETKISTWCTQIRRTIRRAIVDHTIADRANNRRWQIVILCQSRYSRRRHKTLSISQNNCFGDPLRALQYDQVFELPVVADVASCVLQNTLWPKQVTKLPALALLLVDPTDKLCKSSNFLLMH